MSAREKDKRHKEIWRAIGKIEKKIEGQEQTIEEIEADVQLIRRERKKP